MSNVRNWASAAVVAGLILLAPIIAFVVVITVEMLGDLMARAGAKAIWPVVAGGMAWVLLRKFGRQPATSRLRSEGA
jgi:predicted anti-sigma-YlaC factor YlaD